MPQTLSPQLRRTLCALLLVGAAALLLLLARFATNLPPTQLDEQTGGANIHFEVERSQVLLASECIRAAWSVDGIREVYINGEATVGTGERETCLWNTQPKLRVVFEDGSERVYTLPVRILSYNGIFWALALAVSACLIAAVRVAKPSVLVNTGAAWRHLQRRAVILWAGLLEHPLLVVSAITLVGAGLRIAYLNDFSLVLDEAAMWEYTRGSIAETLHLNAYGNSAPPLFALVLHLWQSAGVSELWLRLLPAVASILAIPAMYALARQIFSRRAGYFAALLVATAPAQVQYAQYLREYSLTVLLASLSVYAFMKLRQPSGKLIWLSVWVISLLTQYGLVLLVMALNALFLLEILLRRERNTLKRGLAMQFVLALTIAVVYLTALRFQLAGGSADTWYRMFYWDGFPASLGGYIVTGFSGLMALSYGNDVALIAFGALAAIGLAFLLARRRRLLPVVFLPVFAAMMAGILGYYPYIAMRQMMYLTPLFILVASTGFDYLRSLRDQQPLRWVAAAALIAGTLGNLTTINSYYTRPGYDQIRSIVETLKAAQWENDAVFVTPNAYPMFDYYYLAEDPSRMATFTRASGNDAAFYGAQLDELRSHSQRVWVIMNCCEDTLQAYLSERGERAIAPFATDTNISLFLLD